jgi:hypothetical protein
VSTDISIPGGQRSNYPAQFIPSCLVQGWVGTDQIANHVPGSYVESPFWGWAHRERNRALWAKTDPLRGRFLPRLDPDRLGEHINGNGFAATLEFTIAAKTEEIFQSALSGRVPLFNSGVSSIRNAS